MTDHDELLDFVTSLAGEKVRKVEEDLGAGYFKLNIGEAERRQAKHDIRSVEDAVIELIRNSRDAGASTIFVAAAKDSSGRRQLTIIDDGNGIPREFHESVFQPRVTSKIDAVIEDRFGVHGRGMALYSIRANADEIKLLDSEPGRGAVFSTTLLLTRLRERKDQSTFPKLKVTSGREIKVVSGPHNIWRNLVEMSLDFPELNIYFGAPADILATLLAWGDKSERLQRPIWDDIYTAGDAETLCVVSSRFGLKTSSRTCQRILGGTIEPVYSIKRLLTQLRAEAPPKKSLRSPAGRISREDLDALAKGAADSFRNIGDKYFLKLKSEPKISCAKTKVTIELEVDSDESW